MNMYNLAENHSKLRKISKEYPTSQNRFACTRDEVFRKMKDAMEAAARSVRKVQVRNLFQKLRKVKIGTREVEEAAKKVVGPEKRERSEKEVLRVMGIRLGEAERNMTRMRIDHEKKIKKVRDTLNISQMMK
jgi:DNA-directed RNA polymerase specialized sigma subunit